MNKIIHNDCQIELKNIEENSIDLIYIDPPFNTGKTQKIHDNSYEDDFEDFKKFLYPKLILSKNILKNSGSIFVHIDSRESHYVKIWLDEIFGRNCFMNEIIWAYDFGGRSKKKWSNKHDTIFWYVKDLKNYTYNFENIDRIPYISDKGLVTQEKLDKGKTPTDVWWQTIVPTNSKERLDYPTQKPLKIIERIIKVHSNKYDTVLDFFAGSGTTGEACIKNDRNFILIDKNPQAIEIMKKRFKKYKNSLFAE